MHYFLALILPPLAILLAGKPFQSIFNLILFVVGVISFLLFGFLLWGLCIIHAFFVVHGRKQDKRTKEIISALKDK
jgi:uncharacterized membrane protein YqaE (UPF0057 family)